MPAGKYAGQTDLTANALDVQPETRLGARGGVCMGCRHSEPDHGLGGAFANRSRDIPDLDTGRFCTSKSGTATLLLQSCRRSEAESLGKLEPVKAKVTAEMCKSCSAVMRGAIPDEGLQDESYGVLYERVVTTLATE